MENDYKLSDVIVNYSVNLQKGEKVFIEATDTPDNFLYALLETVKNAGAYPFLVKKSSLLQAKMLEIGKEEYSGLKLKYAMPIMQDMDAYIGIRGINNLYELTSVDSLSVKIDNKIYKEPITDERVNNTKWVILNYPTPSLAQNAGISTPVFEKYFFDVCTLDYQEMDKRMDALKNLMERTDRVRIVGKETDLTFSIKGMNAVKCSGKCNIPDGEIYTAPILDSVNGIIKYTVPTVYQGKRFDNVQLKVKHGKIIEATSSDTTNLNFILDTDQGARYFGEFAIGLNPYIRKPMLDILFDEKMFGSFHLTPGCCYEDADNTNKSAIHWDMVCCQTEEYGGGEIYFDDVLIRKNGIFVLPELQPLNFINN